MAVGREIVRRHRALDYLPPVDVTFLEYLRALITADFDLVGDDRYNYRVAFVEAFSRRGGRRRRSRSLRSPRCQADERRVVALTAFRAHASIRPSMFPTLNMPAGQGSTPVSSHDV